MIMAFQPCVSMTSVACLWESGGERDRVEVRQGSQRLGRLRRKVGHGRFARQKPKQQQQNCSPAPHHTALHKHFGFVQCSVHARQRGSKRMCLSRAECRG